RDVKPENVRITPHGEVKLLDFGIARSDEVDREARTGTGSTVGSLSYMAPERFSREPPGPEADVYALGCTLFECLSGTRLHEDPVPVEMFRLAANADTHDRHVTDALAKLDAPGGVKALLQRMLTHDKSARPDAEEVASKCDALQEGMAGDSLKRWARARMWPDPARVSGAFDGRTITEGTLSGAQDGLEPLPEIPTQTADTFSFDVPSLRPEPVHTESLVPTERVAPPPEDRRSPVALVAVVLVLFLFGGGALAMALSGETTPPPVPPIPVAVPVPVPVPEPVVPAPVEPEPAVEPEPVEPEPTAAAPSRPKPSPRPKPQPTRPQPTPQPAAPAPMPVAPAPIAPVPAPPPAPAQMETVPIEAVHVMVSNNIEVKKCFVPLFKAGALPPRVDAKFTISPAGQASGVTLLQQPYRGTELEACLGRAIATIRFPAASKGTAITYPFVMQ
ncbi:MAG: protein kinase, partial [Myxococcales bacterium]|nr:protein kinase [Myxococcales bacterium]